MLLAAKFFMNKPKGGPVGVTLVVTARVRPFRYLLTSHSTPSVPVLPPTVEIAAVEEEEEEPTTPAKEFKVDDSMGTKSTS